jgi:hypothetical protein
VSGSELSIFESRFWLTIITRLKRGEKNGQDEAEGRSQAGSHPGDQGTLGSQAGSLRSHLRTLAGQLLGGDHQFILGQSRPPSGSSLGRMLLATSIETPLLLIVIPSETRNP